MMFFTKVILFYMFTIRFGILSHKSFVNRHELNPKNVDECQRCKVLTDSFKKWMDRTSRGKHEGGDAAWEEAKLKSYAQSEMRLVEIQEKLCSELKSHQDECYALSEEVETLLEQWWFQENHSFLDLYTWLCIEKLQYCCPPNHFGKWCEPCPPKINNKICNGNGKCNGDGTRWGDGRCICNKGYTGNLCDECSANFYNSSEGCKPCHHACDGCHNEGKDSCIECTGGWRMDSGICYDIDECSDPYVCHINEYCINKVGSYECKPCYKTCETCEGPGAFSCTSCIPNHVLWSGECINSKYYRHILLVSVLRLGLYIIVLLFSIFLLRNNKYMSVILLTLSAVIIFFEDNSKINSFKIINNFMQRLYQ